MGIPATEGDRVVEEVALICCAGVYFGFLYQPVEIVCCADTSEWPWVLKDSLCVRPWRSMAALNGAEGSSVFNS